MGENKVKQYDTINNPSHYHGKNGMEAIDVIENFIGDLAGKAGWAWGNSMKYLLRFQKKNGIEDVKKEATLGYALFCPEQARDEEVYEWVTESTKNQELFAHAWIDGYTVEKEKRYEVILCNGQSLKTVYRQGEDRLDFEKVYGDIERFTRKQLEEAGFGWVFDCEGMEVKEV